MTVSRDQDRAELARIHAAREQQADTEAAGSWMSRGLARLNDEQLPPADPGPLVHMQKDPGQYENPYKVAARVTAKYEDPYVQAFRQERERFVSKTPFGQSSYGDRNSN